MCVVFYNKNYSFTVEAFNSNLTLKDIIKIKRSLQVKVRVFMKRR